MRNVVVFCGGRGGSSILSSLAATPDVQLTAVVNAYDSGLSTGRVRRAIDGMLGPSDLRKNVSTLLRARGKRVPVVELLEHRLPAGLSSPSAEQQLRALRAGQLDLLPDELFRLAVAVEHAEAATIRDALGVFLSHVRDFDFSDLAIGNAVLGGLFLMHGDLDLAVAHYSENAGLFRHRVVNVTRGEDLWLSASSGPRLCPDEGTLVAGGLTQPVDDLFLLTRADHDAFYSGSLEWGTYTQTPACFEQLPVISSTVRSLIATADVIVYSPGTQHSSLYPSYLTIGLAEAIAMNVRAPKIMLTNAGLDVDQFETETLEDHLRKFMHFMTRRGEVRLSLPHVVSDLAVTPAAATQLEYLPAGVMLHAADWADTSGRHLGALVVQLLDGLTVGQPKHAVRSEMHDAETA